MKTSKDILDLANKLADQDIDGNNVKGLLNLVTELIKVCDIQQQELQALNNLRPERYPIYDR